MERVEAPGWYPGVETPPVAVQSNTAAGILFSRLGSPMKRLFVAGSCTLFLGLVVACSGAGSSGGSGGTDPTKKTESKKAGPRRLEPEPEEANRVTMAKYNAIKDGMTYSQVVKIIGFDGEEMSSSGLGGTKTIMYGWKNPGGANMNAMFQDDKLISKAQFGLK